MSAEYVEMELAPKVLPRYDGRSDTKLDLGRGAEERFPTSMHNKATSSTKTSKVSIVTDNLMESMVLSTMYYNQLLPLCDTSHSFCCGFFSFYHSKYLLTL